MLLYKISFAKVFLLLAVIRNSVTNASNSSVIGSSPTTAQIPATPSISPNATTTTPIPSSTSNTMNTTSIPGANSNTTSIPGANSNTTSIPGANSNTTSIPGTTSNADGSSGNVPSGGSPTEAPTTGSSITFPPATTTPLPTTIPTTPGPCEIVTRPTDMESCGNESCALKMLNDMELYIRCGKTGSEDYSKHPTSLADTGESLALRISQDIKTKLDTQKDVNATVVIATDQLALGASTIDSSMYTNSSGGVFSFPNISMEGTKEKLGSRASNSIRYFRNDLPIRSGRVRVAWSISEARDTKVPEDETEPFRDIVWRLPVSDMRIEKNKILVNKEKPDLVINSPVITFLLEPKPTAPLQNPFRIQFKRSKNDGVKNHRCYFWSGTSSAGFWSSIGSSLVLNNETHTVCSYNHMSTFVVLSEAHPEADETARKVVRIVAIVFCVLAIAALVATIHMAKKLDVLDNDRVNIHIHLCVVLIIGYFLFIIGAVKSDIGVLNDILSIALHFCQLSPFVWLCLEAVYFINTICPIFNYENTNTQKLYISLGWALTAAFAGATAGYNMPHNGQPMSSEIVWVFIDKATYGYFFGPFLALFVVNILLRLGLVIHVFIRPQQNDGSKAPLRI
ncbi:adhesion G -coupled receptor L3-like, partial [Paramuricea clavata]